MGRQCCSPGCRNTSGLHSFPADRDIRQLWLRALSLPADRELPPRAGVCNRHFSRDCYSNLMEVEMGFSKVPMLKSDAVPNVALPVPTTGPPSQQLRLLLPATPTHFQGTSGSLCRILPDVRHVASQTDAPERTSVRCKATQARVPSRDCGVCTLTFPLDSPLLFLQPIIAKRPSKRPSKRPRLSLTDEEEGPSQGSSSTVVHEPEDST